MRRLILLALVLTVSPTTAKPQAAAAAAPPESINLRRTVTVQVVDKVKDSVVNISTTKLIARRRAPLGFSPFWDDLDGGNPVHVPAHSLGTGFIIHEDGYLVTNHHVVDRARQIAVELSDGRKLNADLISSDDESDIAILKIASDRPLVPLALGDTADLMIGEPVIAVGNPMGFSHSVSTGIVSAMHRDLKAPDERILLADLIQTDAAINPGNSGGPLLNAYAQVIGINTAIRGDAQNIGFSIPINKLRELIPELMNPSCPTPAAFASSLSGKARWGTRCWSGDSTRVAERSEAPDTFEHRAPFDSRIPSPLPSPEGRGRAGRRAASYPAAAPV